MIEDILRNFNWGRCVKAMRAINWRWVLVEGDVQEDNLKRTAIRLMETAMNGVKSKDVHFRSSYFSESGGLKATAWKNRYGHIVSLNLEFVLTDWESDGDYFQDNLQ